MLSRPPWGSRRVFYLFYRQRRSHGSRSIRVRVATASAIMALLAVLVSSAASLRINVGAAFFAVSEVWFMGSLLLSFLPATSTLVRLR